MSLETYLPKKAANSGPEGRAGLIVPGSGGLKVPWLAEGPRGSHVRPAARLPRKSTDPRPEGFMAQIPPDGLSPGRVGNLRAVGPL